MPLQLILSALREEKKRWFGIVVNLIRGWQELKKSCIHLLFPSRCLQCQELILPGSAVFCPSCASLLELIDPKERCPTCFIFKEEGKRPCENCKRYPPLFFRVAAAFDYQGPAAALIKHLKYANQPYLAKGAAAFLVAQFDRLKWPLPDAIIPVPLSFSHWLERGYNQSALLAEELGGFLKVPVWNALKRLSGDYSQAGLTREQRGRLGGRSFKLKGSYPLQDKRLLLVDDVMTSGATLRICAEAVSRAYPSSLYALTFCRALD